MSVTILAEPASSADASRIPGPTHRYRWVSRCLLLNGAAVRASNPARTYLVDTKAPATLYAATSHVEPDLNPDMTSFCRRHPLLGHPIPAADLGPPHGRLTEHAQACPDPSGLPRAARTSCDRGGRPLTRGQRCSPRARRLPAGASATSQRPVPATRHTSHRQGVPYEVPLRVHTSSPARSSPRLWPPGWNGPPLGSSPGFAPRRPRAGRRTPSWGQPIEHGPGTTTRSTHIRRSPAR